MPLQKQSREIYKCRKKNGLFIYCKLPVFQSIRKQAIEQWNGQTQAPKTQLCWSAWPMKSHCQWCCWARGRWGCSHPSCAHVLGHVLSGSSPATKPSSYQVSSASLPRTGLLISLSSMPSYQFSVNLSELHCIWCILAKFDQGYLRMLGKKPGSQALGLYKSLAFMKCRLKTNPELRKAANASGCCRMPETEMSDALCGTEAASTFAKRDTELGMQHQRGFPASTGMGIPVQIFTWWESAAAIFCYSQPGLCLLCVRCEGLQQVRCPSAESRDVQVLQWSWVWKSSWMCAWIWRGRNAKPNNRSLIITRIWVTHGYRLVSSSWLGVFSRYFSL